MSRALGLGGSALVALTAALGCSSSGDTTGETSAPGATGGMSGAGGGSAGNGGAVGGGGTGGGHAGTGGMAAAGSGGSTGGGGGAATGGGGAATGGNGQTGGGGTSAGNGGSAAGAGGGSGGTGGGDGGAGGANATTMLELPQLVHGAAYVDADSYASIDLVVNVVGATPGSITLDFGAQNGTVTAAPDTGSHFVAAVDVASLGEGTHDFTVLSATNGAMVATTKGTLVVAKGSLQFTDFSMVGPSVSGHVWHDVASDRLGLTWVSVAGGTHRAYLTYVDGAFRRLEQKPDVVLSDPADDALQAETAVHVGALADGAIGVVYLVPSPADGHWQVKMRAVNADGSEKVPTQDLTGGQSAFHAIGAGIDAGGFSGAWIHITDGVKPLEMRFSRWDTKAGKLVGPLTLDTDSPAPPGGKDPLSLATLSEIDVACNDSICLVTYTKDVYNALVDLNVPKLTYAVVDLTTGAQVGTPKTVEASDWDTQEFGQHLIAEPDGSFLLVYTANDTAAAVTPKSDCDDSIERDLMFAVRIDAAGVVQGAPKAVFDFEGSREYPRVVRHPAGYALFWEDQRSECGMDGHIGMAPNVMSSDFALLDTYVEDPGSRVLAPMFPTLDATGTNFVHGWMDNRHGNGLVDPKPELFLDTYWRK